MIVIRPLAGRAANKNIIQRPGAGGCYPAMVPQPPSTSPPNIRRYLIQLEFYQLIGFMPSNQIMTGIVKDLEPYLDAGQ